MKILAFPFKRVVGHMEEQTIDGKKQFVEMLKTGSRDRILVLHTAGGGCEVDSLRKESQVD